MSETRPCALLLSGAQVVTVDDARAVHTDGAVAVDGNRVVDVGPTADLVARWRPHRTVDCRGSAVLPGFTDAHTHLFQSLARGIGDGMAIGRWLNEFMWPYAIHLDAEDARVAARLGAVEAAGAGITTVVDHHYAPSDPETVLAVADAIEEIGLRGAVARACSGTVPPSPRHAACRPPSTATAPTRNSTSPGSAWRPAVPSPWYASGPPR